MENEVNKFYVYIHCKPDGSPFYVGKGVGNRVNKFYGRNKHYLAILNKYGKENISTHVFYCSSEYEAFSDEVRIIKQFRNEGFKLANITNGGEGVSGLKKTVTDSHREKLSKSLKGNKNSIGYRHTLVELKRMSERMKKRPPDLDTLCLLKQMNQKKVICKETNKVFVSATDAALHMGIKDKSSVTKCCRGVTKTAYGYTFQYI